MQEQACLCMGCMEQKQNGYCPNPATCGWTDTDRNPSELQLQPHTLLEQRYLIGKVLGQGGFGITYLSYDLKDHRKLAIKEYFPSSYATRRPNSRTVTFSSPENRYSYHYGLKKFAQEARTLARLRGHANILAVVDFIEANETGYIVMEYLEGITLAKYLAGQEHGKMPFERALSILVPIMDALREVHAANTTHRDVSPDNIILCKGGPIKLIDFGAAKEALRDPRTQQLILKAGYTPWEQYLTDGVTGPWTDVYSLAATIYRCITGIIPPEAPIRLSDDKLLPPRAISARLPAEAEKALLRALAVRSKNRYQTIAEFQTALTSHQRPTPSSPDLKREPSDPAPASGVLHTPQSWWSQFWKDLIPPSPEPRAQSKIGLRFTAGDQNGETLEIGKDPIVIGRDPKSANLVILSPHISAAHVKVSSDLSGRAVRMEDLRSRNGTYFRKLKGNGKWSRLIGSELLFEGDKFYLYEERTAIFEVITL